MFVVCGFLELLELANTRGERVGDFGLGGDLPAFGEALEALVDGERVEGVGGGGLKAAEGALVKRMGLGSRVRDWRWVGGV